MSDFFLGRSFFRVLPAAASDHARFPASSQALSGSLSWFLSIGTHRASSKDCGCPSGDAKKGQYVLGTTTELGRAIKTGKRSMTLRKKGRRGGLLFALLFFPNPNPHGSRATKSLFFIAQGIGAKHCLPL